MGGCLGITSMASAPHLHEQLKAWTSYMKGLAMCFDVPCIMMAEIDCLLTLLAPQSPCVRGSFGGNFACFGSQNTSKMVTATHPHGSTKADVSFYQEHGLCQHMGQLSMEMLLCVHRLAPTKGVSHPTFQLFWKCPGAHHPPHILCPG